MSESRMPQSVQVMVSMNERGMTESQGNFVMVTVEQALEREVKTNSMEEVNTTEFMRRKTNTTE
jgi:hypothetical protein